MTNDKMEQIVEMSFELWASRQTEHNKKKAKPTVSPQLARVLEQYKSSLKEDREQKSQKSDSVIHVDFSRPSVFEFALQQAACGEGAESEPWYQDLDEIIIKDSSGVDSVRIRLFKNFKGKDLGIDIAPLDYANIDYLKACLEPHKGQEISFSLVAKIKESENEPVEMARFNGTVDADADLVTGEGTVVTEQLPANATGAFELYFHP